MDLYTKWAIKIAIGLITGYFATRKNRSFTFWACMGTAGGIALVVLAFLPHLCKRCQQKVTAEEAKLDDCWNCMTVQADSSPHETSDNIQSNDTVRT
ncbi:hypothetical protein COW36_15975 [bacterium (Candidatus Blackallbacteria) CG17_big_fil_post_rev_8_21_14_2_50_48_46]|uniref:Uncharacterized protein n=1 Tax=bacterium (Candidatus Blackallbacteria) CG17_big_fil_post_rev_8_21_14_2_50_48_46 TaxID=2014261 RepID=A0A2M7G1Y4_9BACT|nr:MAG: hypothetical protein COW64_09125 [bacterium (Candidatus Blackallbacteria) CG18_big_fil_WC_8_21_14_2_50_49_26]PIW15766.1 MAG: hypothetical protein COW36_15975 [bacterium (Candidatus Blackallbacteria) CG17_big_fil_post_rev_8_21_14_2_50_48_46]PIW48736.1 MAG: hypothetical protein COW20_08280 [bacterium (Candidatus Blackallbacteria) CG13_big_fil_rev_8_21_14_2_50_49_14]